MSTLTVKPEPLATEVSFTADALHVVLADGREISAPLIWFPRLLNATPTQRSNWRLIGHGIGMHWQDLDEDISVESLLAIK
ncbi:MAG TPA: DUF2442 domain-containing protein [Tepidisphaeraceae bacterium]|jgi:hypothetical protein|nr:DUF2442 domain-containing protein [Tepidisphaeraceae bacterium]